LLDELGGLLPIDTRREGALGFLEGVVEPRAAQQSLNQHGARLG